MIIINTGGTFNKRYNHLNGVLEVPKDSLAIESVISKFTNNILVKGIIFKDSLEMSDDDRELLSRAVEECESHCVIIVHGTDTMELSASYLAKKNYNKKVIFTGAMVPFFIDEVEATSNLSLAIGFAIGCEQNGIYIAMQGIVDRFERVKKNKKLGKFEIV